MTARMLTPAEIRELGGLSNFSPDLWPACRDTPEGQAEVQGMVELSGARLCLWCKCGSVDLLAPCTSFTQRMKDEIGRLRYAYVVLWVGRRDLQVVRDALAYLDAPGCTVERHHYFEFVHCVRLARAKVDELRLAEAQLAETMARTPGWSLEK